MEDNQKKEEILDFNSILIRAEGSEKALKFNISSNHFYTLLTKLKDNFDINALNEIKHRFKYNVFFLSAGTLKDKMLNFILNSEMFSLDYKETIIMKKLLLREIIYDDEIVLFIQNAPNIFKDFISSDESFVERYLFEHNIFSLSLLYDNISIRTIECLLNKKGGQLDSLLFKIINEGKVKAKIDENSGFLYFGKDQNEIYDSQVKNFCSKVVLLNEIK